MLQNHGMCHRRHTMDTKTSEIKEIFPICLHAGGHKIWVGWRLVDLPETPLVGHNGNLLWANSKKHYVDNYYRRKKSGNFETETEIDLDGVLSALESRKDVKPDDLLNAWNMLTDIRNSLDYKIGFAFSIKERECLGTYDRVFSATATSGIVKFYAGALKPKDFENAAAVISMGISMLLNATVLSRRSTK